MSLKLEVKGIPTLKAQLEKLGHELATKEVRAAARRAFKPVLIAAIAKAPNENETTGATGLTKRSIRIAAVINKNNGAVNVGLTVRKVRGAKGRDPSWRWHFIELGTRTQRARPFLRPALDANAQKVVDTLQAELAKGIKKALRKKALMDVARETARSLR